MHGQLGTDEVAREPLPMMNRRSCSFAVIIAQQSSQSFPACDLTRLPSDFLPGKEQLVFHSLMISLRMIIRSEIRCGILERSFPKQDPALKTLLLQASHKTLDVRSQVR